MEIVYFFVKEENKLINQNVNLGSEFIFNYSTSNKKLSVEKNELYIKGLFSHTNKSENNATLLNITSIIGENGTGKTSLLNLLKDNLVSGIHLQTPLILVAKVNNVYKIYYTETLPISNQDTLRSNEFQFYYIKKKINLSLPGRERFGYDFRGFEQTDFIYFSNVFDNVGGSYSLNGLRDISTNSLVTSYHKAEIDNKYFQTNIGPNELARYHTNEIERQIRFVQAYLDKDIIPFDLPSELIFSTKDDFFKFDLTSKNNEINESLKKHIDFIIKNNSEDDSMKRIILNMYISFLIESISFDYIASSSSFITEVSSKESVINNLNCYGSFVGKALYLIQFIEYIVDLQESMIFFKKGNYLSFTFSKELNKEFFMFLDLYSKSIILKPYLDFYWRNLSSGEKALLTFYSRFFALTQHKIYNTKQLQKHLIILIDEGDLYLHPAWQKKFVKILVDFFPNVFRENQRTIQIIFTTNSPIPASDLFNYNTVFLEKIVNKDGEIFTIVKDSLNDKKETFAANIHTLFSDSFFVRDGLMGDFSSSILDKIIDQFNQRSNLTYQERERTRKIIHQVGERILKVKLLQLYNDRYNLDIHERLDKIEEELKSKINDKN